MRMISRRVNPVEDSHCRVFLRTETGRPETMTISASRRVERERTAKTTSSLTVSFWHWAKKRLQLRWLPLSLRRGFRCVVSARVPSRSTRRMRGLSCLSAIWVSRSRSPRDSSALCEKDDVSVMTISPRTCQESPLETLSQTSQRDPGSLLCNTNLPLD